MGIITLRGQLCGHMAASLATHLVKMSGSDGPARSGDSFWHGCQTDFEAAQAALERIRVFLPRMDADGSTQQAFVVDAVDMPDFLGASVEQADPRIPELLEAFLRVACGYGGLSDGLDWFTSPPNWAIAMKHLAGSGYAVCDGSRFRWTERVIPAMRSAGLWNEAGQSLEQLAAAEAESEADLAWRTMPDTLRESIQSSRIGFIELVKVLALSWKDGAWHEFKRDGYFGLSGQVALLRR
jgi:hypothetical protein